MITIAKMNRVIPAKKPKYANWVGVVPPGVLGMGVGVPPLFAAVAVNG